MSQQPVGHSHRFTQIFQRSVDLKVARKFHHAAELSTREHQRARGRAQISADLIDALGLVALHVAFARLNDPQQWIGPHIAPNHQLRQRCGNVVARCLGPHRRRP